MISYTRETPYAVRFTGLSDLQPPAWWHAVLGRVGGMWQKRISARYMREQAPTLGTWKKLKPNTLRWNARKAKKGYSRLRGHMLNRIQNALMNGRLYSVSAVVGTTFHGTNTGLSAVVTLDEEALRQIVPHARHYAKMKAPLRRLLAINLPMIAEALRMLNAVHVRMVREEAIRRRAEERRARAQTLRATRADRPRRATQAPKPDDAARLAAATAKQRAEEALSAEVRAIRTTFARNVVIEYQAARRPWTLAATATSVTAKCIAALRRV